MMSSRSQANLDLASSNGPVECLGLHFDSEDQRRQHFISKLRKHLGDPAFRNQDGFPVGSIEDIIRISDPPYYTACPNPFLKDFTKTTDDLAPYSRLPFAADVTEGKSDRIYVAHSYHTKVPHRAIMRYILHYTCPGDVVLDLFCGTGMTGVASQLCASRSEVASLGYRVDDSGTVYGGDGAASYNSFSEVGARQALLLDLSPAATFIAYNQNNPSDGPSVVADAERALEALKRQHGWMFRTLHSPSEADIQAAVGALAVGKACPELSTGQVNYCIWSQVFNCPSCAYEMSFWDVAVDAKNGLVREIFPCPSCTLNLNKRDLDASEETVFDPSLGRSITRIKTALVRVNYSFAGKRFDKKPDAYDTQLASHCESLSCPYPHPTNRLMPGTETRRNDGIGVTHVHQFYTRRNLLVFAGALELLPAGLSWAVTGSLQRGSKQHQIAITRIGGEKAGVGGATAGHRRGTLYIPSNQVEMNPIQLLSDRIAAIRKGNIPVDGKSYAISTQSATRLGLDNETVDYIFVDPPFGANIAYSELNSLMESWLKVGTNQDKEAIQDRYQKKSLHDYRELMSACFTEAYRVLKPGRWMTVEFSNTQASVWNSIQTALQSAGFIVANVSVLDKKRGGLNSITGVTAVKQDLIISAYKPNGGLEERFWVSGGTEDTAWDFVQTHLKNLPVFKMKSGSLEAIAERDPRRIYDRMVAWFVRHNTEVPLSSLEFQQGIGQRFPIRDGMVFLSNQVDEYDRKKIFTGAQPQIDLFVDDEKTAIEWLRDFLQSRPSTYQDINPLFTQKIGAGWRKHEARPELSGLLEANFLQYDGKGPVPAQIHSYLSSNWKELRNLDKSDPALIGRARGRWYVPDPAKQQDVEKRREKLLAKEFEKYINHRGRKLKEVRLEALRVGFKAAWSSKEYNIILEVASKIAEDAWQEDERLLTFVDMAETRLRSKDG